MAQRLLIKDARKRKAPPRRDCHDESWHQQRFIRWSRESARMQFNPAHEAALLWLHSVPNGAHLSKRQAIKMVAEGMTAGIHDLRLDYVLRDSAGAINCPGLIIEMKMPGRALSEKQKEYASFMHSQGFRHVICRSWQEAARCVVDYMSLKIYAPIHP
ncbi:MAG TPA: hypothetical protein VNN73_17450 [Blastocatellia bacterium]|nr:hypothetical protein [Blastocatellia bacterium]